MVQIKPGITSFDERGGDLCQLIDATREMREHAETAIRWSARLVAEACNVCDEARSHCMVSQPRRLYARLTGEVDGRVVQAVVRTDGKLFAERRLKQRADLLVRLGETFEGDVAASMSGSPLATVLTLIRACDRVTDFEVVIPAELAASRG